MSYRLLYFASLREAAGTAEERIDASEADLRTLYARLAARHGFAWAPERLRVAVNGAFVDWDRPLVDGDEIAFLPPVSGG